MAIIQISKIQVRQGNLIDIPQLSPGEFGWADDQRRLFIGNEGNRTGDPIPNNTEILTSYSPINGMNIVGNLTAGGANGDFQYNSNGIIAGSSVINYVPQDPQYGCSSVTFQQAEFVVLDTASFNVGVSNLHIGGGVDGQILGTDGAGNLSWVNSGSGNGNPAAPNTSVQYNDGGIFGGSANFVFDPVTNLLNVGNLTVGIQSNISTFADTVRIGAGYIAVGNTPGLPPLSSGQIWADKLQATYADLAEYYHSDEHYEPGTVLDFGGEQEVTISMTDMSQRVAGVVSTDPAYVMNGAIKDDIKSVVVALQGRVPTRVVGYVHKGDMIVSAGNGLARSEAEPVIGSVIGKAIENKDYAEEGVIEVVIGRL